MKVPNSHKTVFCLFFFLHKYNVMLCMSLKFFCAFIEKFYVQSLLQPCIIHNFYKWTEHCTSTAWTTTCTHNIIIITLKTDMLYSFLTPLCYCVMIQIQQNSWQLTLETKFKKIPSPSELKKSSKEESWLGSKSFRPDIQKPRHMENAVRDI